MVTDTGLGIVRENITRKVSYLKWLMIPVSF